MLENSKNEAERLSKKEGVEPKRWESLKWRGWGVYIEKGKQAQHKGVGYLPQCKVWRNTFVPKEKGEI